MADENKNISTDTFKMPMLKGVGDASAPGAPLPGTSIADDTRTRRTVRLNAIRPAGVGTELKPLPAENVVSTDSGVISDPLAGRGTDSGIIAGVSRPNVQVKPITGDLAAGALDDTRTRKTVQLASLTAKAKTEASGAAVSLQSVRAGDVDDTIKLQRHEAPSMPGGIGAATVPSPGISLAKTDNSQFDSTHTQAIARATALSAASDLVLPDPKSVVAPGMDTNTQAMLAVNIAKSTIKIKPQKESAKATPAPAPAADSAVNLVRTPVKEATVAKAASAPAPAPAPAPAAKPAPAAPAPAPAAKPAPAAQAAAPVARKPIVARSTVSPIYTYMAAAALLAMIFAATLTIIQCINVWHPDLVGGEPIQLPFIGSDK